LQGLDEAEANLGDSEEPDREEGEEEKEEEEKSEEVLAESRSTGCSARNARNGASSPHLGGHTRTSFATASSCDVHNRAMCAKPLAARFLVLPSKYC